MKEITNTFLDKYKELEGLLRNSIQSLRIVEYEDSIPSDRKEKLRLCRNIRNYIQHEKDSDNFIVPTETMVLFLENEINILTGNTKVKRTEVNLYYVEPILISDTLYDVASCLRSHNRYWFPVIDYNNKPIGIVNYDFYEQCIGIGYTTATTLEQLQGLIGFKDISISRKGQEIDNSIIVNEQGQYVGVKDGL